MPSTELYDPVQGEWLLGDNLRPKLALTTLSLLPNNRALVAGGTDIHNVASNAAEIGSVQ